MVAEVGDGGAEEDAEGDGAAEEGGGANGEGIDAGFVGDLH